MRTFLSRFAAFALLSLSTHAATNLTVQVVNDSGLDDDQVFVLLSGQPQNGLVASIPVANSSSGFVNNPAVAAQSVQSLTNTGTTVVSTYSGRTLPVYEFTVTSIKSGILYVMYGAPGNPTASPFSYGSAAPSPITTEFRFSQLELTYDENLVSVADLTNIDYFSIPMQLEGFSSGVPGTLSTVYDSTDSLIAELQSLNLSPAFRSTSNPDPSSGSPWNPATDSLATFARVLGPGQYAATSATGDPSPYPSFKDYLDSLVAANYTWTDTGFQNGSSFSYVGSIASDGNGGYTITLAPASGGAPDPAPPAPLPPASTITIHLPSGTASGATTANNFDTYIYGCVLDYQSFSLSGSTMDEATFNTNAPNSVYGAIVADALAGLNFGYLGGKWGNAVEGWFADIPTAPPFGGARSPNDGYYNPWAAFIYNTSDSYGFAFSDRSGPSPAVPLDTTGNGTLLLTILPDDRLDAPRASVTGVTADSLDVEWPAVEGATSYTVQVVPPYPAADLTVTADGSATYSRTITGLAASTPYSITVIANGTANANPITSAYIPIQATTAAGTFTPTSGAIGFKMGFNWNGPDGSTITINNTPYTLTGGGIPILNLTGAAGMNSYPIVVSSVLPGQSGSAQSVVYQGNIFIELEGDSTSYSVGPLPETTPVGFSPFLIGNLGAFLTGQNSAGGNNLTIAGDPSENPPFTNTFPATLGVPFNPYALKVVSPIVVPGASPTPTPTPTPDPTPTPTPQPTATPAPTPNYQPTINEAQRDLRTLKKDIKKTKRTETGRERKQTIQQLQFSEKVARSVIADPSNNAMVKLLNQSMKATKIKNAGKRQKKFKKLEKKYKKIR